MSRLFSRLARQAVGQPRNPVRPVVMPAFAEPGMQQDSPLQTDGHTRRPATTRGSDRTPTSPAQTSAASNPKINNGTGDITNAQAQRKSDNETVAAAALTFAPKPILDTAQPQASVATDNKHSSAIPEPLPTAVNGALSPSLGRAVNTNTGTQECSDVKASTELAQDEQLRHAPATLMPENSSDRDQNNLSPSTEGIVAQPTSLLPQVALPVSAAVNNQQRMPSAPRAAVAQEREVHIHIGRIDVRSETQPDNDQRGRQSKRPRQPLSLEDYLAQRGKRRP